MQLIVFLLGSLGVILLSRQALLHRRVHGFPRFFAFEAILALAVLNAPAWFDNPFAARQVISWILLLVSIDFALHAILLLRKHGAIDLSIQDVSQISFEKTTRLVTSGLYRYVRHPMYASLLFFAWGSVLKRVELVPVLLALIASLALFLTATYEEQENLRKFGQEYAQYMRRTRRFIPFIF